MPSVDAGIPRKPSATCAQLPWRLFAAIYDLLPLLALWFIATALALALSGGALDVHNTRDRIAEQICVLLISAAYFGVSWWRGGQTVGMRAWSLRVVSADGSGLSVTQALVRFVVALVSIGALGLGFLWCLVDAERRGWHDIAAGTLLVRVAKS